MDFLEVCGYSMWKLAWTKSKFRYFLLVLLGVTLIVGFFVIRSQRDPNVRKQKYYRSAVSYFQKAKYREASIQLQNAILLDPQYADAHYQLAQCYMKMGMWAKVLEELNRTVDLAPQNWKAQLDLGNVLLAAKEYGEAEGKAKLVLEAEPQNVDAHTLLAKVMAALGDSRGSLDEMQQAKIGRAHV